MKIASRIFMALVTLAFLPSAIMKLSQQPMVVEGFRRTGIPEAAILPIGAVELACLVLFLIPRTAFLGTLLLTGYLGGATMANIVGGTDFIHALVVGLIVWAAAWCRIPEFRSLLPFRKTDRRPERDAAAA